MLLLPYREGYMGIMPGLHVNVAPSNVSWVLPRLSLGGVHAILLPGLLLGVGRERLPGLVV